MSTKAFSWFFFFLTVINLPVMIFFGTGNSAGEYERFTDIFAILSMGNVGQSGWTCSGVKVNQLYQKNPAEGGFNDKEQYDFYQRESSISLNCGFGSKIKGLAYLGINKNGDSTCKDILTDTSKFKDYFYNSSCIYQKNSTVTTNSLF